jgi:hypothetical protein
MRATRFAAVLLGALALSLASISTNAEPYCFWGMDGFAYCWDPG